MSRKGFVFGCTIISLIVSIVITAIIVVALVTKKPKVKSENVTTEVVSTEVVSTETVIPDDYSERLIQGVLDGDLVTVKDLLEMTNDFVNFKPNENE